MRDHPSSATPVLEDLLAAAPESANGRLRHGGDGARTGLVCGGFALEGDAANPIVRALPPVVHVRGTESEAVSWVAATLELVDAVAESDAPGADAVLARIADTMLTQALRVALADLAAQTPERVLALRDPQIAGAIHLVHGQPERRWTVGELASEVGYSRSAFASRFREVVGESPIAYLTRTRLELAAALLQRADSTLAEVARRSGYTSEYAFNRAFKRAFAVTPGAYRAQPAAERPDVVAAGSSFVTGA